MGLRDIIANGVALADKLTADLQPVVHHLRWVGVDGYNQPSFDPTDLPAIVELKQQIVRNAEGEEVLSSHVVTILREPAPQGTPGRKEPIDLRDQFILGDGTRGQVISVTGFEDSKTLGSYFYQVYLGA